MTVEDVISREDLVKVSENQVALYDRLDNLEKKLFEAKKTPEELQEEEKKKPLTEEKLQKILSEKERKEELKKEADRVYNEALEASAQKFNDIEANIKAACEKAGIPFSQSAYDKLATANIQIGNQEMKANQSAFDWKTFESRLKEDLNIKNVEVGTTKEIKTGSKSLTGVQDEVSMDLEGKSGDRVSELEQALQGHFRAKSGTPRSGDRELSYDELNSLDREVNAARNRLRRGQYK